MSHQDLLIAMTVINLFAGFMFGHFFSNINKQNRGYRWAPYAKDISDIELIDIFTDKDAKCCKHDWEHGVIRQFKGSPFARKCRECNKLEILHEW